LSSRIWNNSLSERASLVSIFFLTSTFCTFEATHQNTINSSRLHTFDMFIRVLRAALGCTSSSNHSCSSRCPKPKGYTLSSGMPISKFVMHGSALQTFKHMHV
jgi:hypothetical protein